jgi:hypothetical protein
LQFGESPAREGWAGVKTPLRSCAIDGYATGGKEPGTGCLGVEARVNLTRFHGVFAPNRKHRVQVTPVELGLRVCVLEDTMGFILHDQVMEKQTDDKVAVSIVDTNPYLGTMQILHSILLGRSG